MAALTDRRLLKSGKRPNCDRGTEERWSDVTIIELHKLRPTYFYHSSWSTASCTIMVETFVVVHYLFVADSGVHYRDPL